MSIYPSTPNSSITHYVNLQVKLTVHLLLWPAICLTLFLIQSIDFFVVSPIVQNSFITLLHRLLYYKTQIISLGSGLKGVEKKNSEVSRA